jgi:hypothetical protein
MFAPLLAAVAVQILFRADMMRDESSGVRLTIKWPNNGRPSTSKLDDNRAVSTSNLANTRSRSTGKLDNKRSRSISKLETKRTSRTAQQYVRKTLSDLRATFDTLLLLRAAEGTYAYCICRCNRGAGSSR